MTNTFLLIGNGTPRLSGTDLNAYERIGACNNYLAEGTFVNFWFNGIMNGDDEKYSDGLYNNMVRTNGERGGTRLRRHKPTTKPVFYIDPDDLEGVNKIHTPRGQKLTTGAMAAWWIKRNLPDVELTLTGFNFYKGEGTQMGYGCHDPDSEERFIMGLGVTLL